MFPLVAACTCSVGVLNGGEAQFEGVRVGSSWKNTTTMNDNETTGHLPARSQPARPDTYLRFSSGSGSSWRGPPSRH